MYSTKQQMLSIASCNQIIDNSIIILVCDSCFNLNYLDVSYIIGIRDDSIIL